MTAGTSKNSFFQLKYFFCQIKHVLDININNVQKYTVLYTANANLLQHCLIYSKVFQWYTDLLQTKNKIIICQLFNAKEESHLFLLLMSLFHKTIIMQDMKTTKNKKLYGIANWKNAFAAHKNWH